MKINVNQFDAYTARLIATEIIAKRRYPFDEASPFDREQQCAQYILGLAALAEDGRAVEAGERAAEKQGVYRG